MDVLRSAARREAEDFRRNRDTMLAQLEWLEREQAVALAGGGPKYVARHRERGRLLARERIELLVDQDSPLLELSPLAASGTDYTTGASVVTAIGVISDVECMILASDPTVRGGTTNPFTTTKLLRAMEI